MKEKKPNEKWEKKGKKSPVKAAAVKARKAAKKEVKPGSKEKATLNPGTRKKEESDDE